MRQLSLLSTGRSVQVFLCRLSSVLDVSFEYRLVIMHNI